MAKPILRLMFSLIVVMTAGCGQSILDAQDARCPFTERGGCQSMEIVNRMVTEKRFTPDGQFVQQGQVIRSHPRASSRFEK